MFHKLTPPVSPASTLAFNFSAPSAPHSPWPAPRPQSSRRRKLWEIPHKFHCPIIGVCFSCAELRRLMGKIAHYPASSTDFVLHTTAVGACQERSPLADLLHKTLEKRYQLTIQGFARLKSKEALQQAWQQCRQEQLDLPATLWAIWSHPACDSELEQQLYGDIHMIQHQVGAGHRVDSHAFQDLKHDKQRLQQQLQALRQEQEQQRLSHQQEQQRLIQQLQALRTELAAKDAQNQSLQQQLHSLRACLPDLEERQQLQQQRDQARQQQQRLHTQLQHQDKELQRLRTYAAYAEETLSTLTQDDAALDALSPTDLQGKCVLCVGGRTGAIQNFRARAEQSGARFLHHDGGVEESLHRIDSAVSAADLVICQAGCISHSAYWRVKDLCKRTGKPCVFVKTSGSQRFAQALNTPCPGAD